jgi:hypothetical protein
MIQMIRVATLDTRRGSSNLKRGRNAWRTWNFCSKRSWKRFASTILFVLLIVSSFIISYRQQQWFRLNSFGEFNIEIPRRQSSLEKSSQQPRQSSIYESFTDVSSGGHARLFDDNLNASTRSTEFSGIITRPFPPWPLNASFPCFRPHERWMEMSVQFTPTTNGFLYLKPYKTGSSTASGVHLRIARNVAKRSTESNFDICHTRFDHGPDYNTGFTLFRNRIPEQSFLWTVLRDPTQRAISEFFHIIVSRQKKEPTDHNFKQFLRQSAHITDYYYRALDTRVKYTRISHKPIPSTNFILQNYNFIGITERMDESFVVLMMLLRLKITDILYLSAKTKGGYDDAGGKASLTCTYIWPSFVSPGMKVFFDSPEWQEKIRYDALLYEAVNRSLDLTIDQLGRDEFEQHLKVFQSAQAIAMQRCLPNTTFPCDTSGYFHDQNSTDCIWKDSGCGATCLDEIATELNLW